jgi:septal ring-binding cell division protein DamX
LTVAAVEHEDDQFSAALERETEATARQIHSPNADQADIRAAPQPQAQAADSAPLPPGSETMSKPKLEQPLIAKLAMPEQTNSTTSPASIADNDRWLFTQPQDFYTLQLISAPRRATVDALIRQRGLKNIRLLRTQVNGARWWYLLSGSYSTREQASAAAAGSTVEQTNIWIRRFGTLQENRCKNFSATELSTFCDGPSVRVPARAPQGRLETDKRQAPAPEQSVASVEQRVVTTPVKPPASTEPKQTPTGPIATAELLSAAREKETAIAGLRHDDNAWLFAQPEDYYTVQLISVPDVSKVARFLRDNKLQDKAIYYTTRREQRDWYFAIYGSHPNLDAAKQAAKTLPVASGSVWIRQFDAIQKRQCQVANQLPAGVSDALNYYCRP